MLMRIKLRGKGPTEYPGWESCKTIDNLPDRVWVEDGLPDTGEHEAGGGQGVRSGPGPGLAPG